MAIKIGIKRDTFSAGGGQGGDVLSQVDDYIDGRPKKGSSEVGPDGHSAQPGFLDQIGFMLRDAVFGKPKVDDIRSGGQTSDPAKTESTLNDTLPNKASDDPMGAAEESGDKTLKNVLHALGGLFGL